MCRTDTGDVIFQVAAVAEIATLSALVKWVDGTDLG